MSYLSCVNSGLLVPEPPIAYPAYDVGYILSCTIVTTATASSGVVNAVADLVIPKGIWAVLGTIQCDAVTAGQTLAGTTSLRKNGNPFWRNTTVTVEDAHSISLSTIFKSDGTDIFNIQCSYTTSGGANFAVQAAPNSIVQLLRIA